MLTLSQLGYCEPAFPGDGVEQIPFPTFLEDSRVAQLPNPARSLIWHRNLERPVSALVDLFRAKYLNRRRRSSLRPVRRETRLRKQDALRPVTYP